MNKNLSSASVDTVEANTRTGQATHAPSPWKWYWRTDENGHTDCGVFYEKREGQAYSICRAPRYQTKEQWEADARLITAAPDLLEACRFLISQVEKLADRSFSEGVKEWLSKCDAVNCGKRAIAKAENT